MVISRNGCTLWCSVFFCEFVNGLVEFYPELYDTDNGSPSELQANFGKKWAAYSTLIDLAGGDITKIDLVTREPLEKCLLYLAFKSDRNKTETLLHNEAMKKMR